MGTKALSQRRSERLLPRVDRYKKYYLSSSFVLCGRKRFAYISTGVSQRKLPAFSEDNGNDNHPHTIGIRDA